MLLLMGTLTAVTGCSSDVPVLSEKSESEIDSQADKVASESESSTTGLPTAAQRAYEVTETPEVPARDDAERQRTGIVSSFDNETLQLNEDGHVFSYRLAKDVSVYYPGGKTDLMDLRQGDEITVFLEDDVSLR